MPQSVSRINLEAAFVLHQRPYRDSSVLLDVFSENHGYVGLVARGVRRRKSAWQSLLQPFTPLSISWSGRGELGTVTGVEANGSINQLSGQVLLSGFYINELLTRLLHRYDPHPELFQYYANLLCQLAILNKESPGSISLQRVLRVFEKKLLQEIGYGLILDHDVISGEPIEQQNMYRYHMNQGPVLADETITGQPGLLISGVTLLAFENEQLQGAESFREAKRLTRLVLDEQLGEKPLNSRRLFADLQSMLEVNTLAKTL